MSHQKKSNDHPILAAWREQLTTARANPFLLQLLLKQWQRILKRLAYFYAQLASLPRRNRRALQRALATSLLGAALLLALTSAPTALANNITVGGACTLDEAIVNANDKTTGQPFADCAAGDPTGADTITLTADVTLAAVLPPITSEITLEGNNYSVSGANSFRVFDVSSKGGDFTINDTTVKEGADSFGAGITNSGTLELNNSTVSGNSGGGIFNIGTLELNNSTVSGNSATSGGGIFNTDTATLNNSTVSGNSVFLGSGGGIYNAGTLDLHRSLISGNSKGLVGRNEIDNLATITANDYNLFGNSGETNADASINFTPGVKDFNATSDGDGTSTHVPTALENILNPTLANNGGPTETHALVAGSPALDKAPNAACAAPPISGVDQRGVTRPQGSKCDIGSFELEQTTAVHLKSFHARVTRTGKVALTWQTTTESQIAGFIVWRKVADGKWEMANDKMIQAKQSGAASGNPYRFVDKRVQSGKRYRYKLEVLYLDGHSEWTNVLKVKRNEALTK